MPFERFGYLVLEQREMVCQHVVKKSRDSHLVASDYMKHLLDAVVVFLADIDLLAEPRLTTLILIMPKRRCAQGNTSSAKPRLSQAERKPRNYTTWRRRRG